MADVGLEHLSAGALGIAKVLGVWSDEGEGYSEGKNLPELHLEVHR